MQPVLHTRLWESPQAWMKGHEPGRQSRCAQILRCQEGASCYQAHLNPDGRQIIEDPHNRGEPPCQTAPLAFTCAPQYTHVHTHKHTVNQNILSQVVMLYAFKS